MPTSSDVVSDVVVVVVVCVRRSGRSAKLLVLFPITVAVAVAVDVGGRRVGVTIADRGSAIGGTLAAVLPCAVAAATDETVGETVAMGAAAVAVGDGETVAVDAAAVVATLGVGSW